MDSTFDIFKITSDGPVWVAAIQGLEEAKERMAEFVLISPAKYFIHSQVEGVVARQSQIEQNGGIVRPTFDIFTDSPDGEPVWIESVETLENAREDLREAARIAPRRDCFIYSNDGGIVEVILRADFQGLRKTYSMTGEHNISRSYRSSYADQYTLRAAIKSRKDVPDG